MSYSSMRTTGTPRNRLSSALALRRWLTTIAIGLLVLAGSSSAADSPIVALAFTPDGDAVVAGSKAGVALYVWPELKPVRKIATVVDDVHDLRFSPNGKYLAIAGGAPAEAGVCEVVLWPESASLCRISGQNDVIYAVAWTANSNGIATGSMDASVVVTTLRPIIRAKTNDNRLELVGRQRLLGHSKGILAVGFMTDAPLLLSAGVDQSIRLWSLKASQPELARTFENHTAAVRGLAIRPPRPDSPGVVASIGEDRTVRFWQPTIGRMMRFTRFDQAAPLSANWLPDGSQLAVACDDGHVRLIDPDTSDVVADIPVHSGWCYALAIHPTTEHLAVGGSAGISKVTLDRIATYSD